MTAAYSAANSAVTLATYSANLYAATLAASSAVTLNLSVTQVGKLLCQEEWHRAVAAVMRVPSHSCNPDEKVVRILLVYASALDPRPRNLKSETHTQFTKIPKPC